MTIDNHRRDALVRQLFQIACDRRTAREEHAARLAREVEIQARAVRAGRRAVIGPSELPPLALGRFDVEARRVLAALRANGDDEASITRLLSMAHKLADDLTWLTR